MLKKIIYILICIIISSNISFGNIIPKKANEIPKATIGLYQLDKNLTVYEKPDKKSKIIFEENIIYPNNNCSVQDNLFAIKTDRQRLGFLYVTDIDEGWAEIIFDKSKNKKGWVETTDEFQFLPWISFFNMYGRKYGLKEFSSKTKNIYAQPNESSQIIKTVQNINKIRLTAIEGNWLLVTVLEYSGETSTGYIKWRNSDGSLNLFPDLK